MPTSVTINNASVQATVYDSSAQETAEALSPNELAVLTQADAILHANLQFTSTYPGAVLQRVESYRGVADGERGRYYLRYQPKEGAATEFWAHVGHHANVNFRSGAVTVPAAAPAPSPAGTVPKAPGG